MSCDNIMMVCRYNFMPAVTAPDGKWQGYDIIPVVIEVTNMMGDVAVFPFECFSLMGSDKKAHAPSRDLSKTLSPSYVEIIVKGMLKPNEVVKYVLMFPLLNIYRPAALRYDDVVSDDCKCQRDESLSGL